jgi:transcriptional antiterminator NusG
VALAAAQGWDDQQRRGGGMNMEYRKGQIVGYVQLEPDGPLVVPMPRRWHLLRVYPNRESKVMKAFRRDNVSAYLPLHIRTISRRTGEIARKPHLGRRVVTPLIPGLIFVPDFELDRYHLIKATDGVDDFVHFGPCLATLSLEAFAELREIEAFLAIPRGQRKFKVGDRVRFKGGLFIDFVGVVERLDSRGRLKVFLDAVKRGVSISTMEMQVELEDPATSDTPLKRGTLL